MFKRFAVVVVLVAMVLAGVSKASSPGAWSPPAVLAAHVGRSLPKVAVQTEAGQTVAAWAGSTGVFVAVAGADRGFGAPQRLTSHAISNDFVRILAVDRRGDTIVIWQQQYSGNPSPGTLFVSYRPAHGSFGAVRRIASDVGGADVGIDAGGNATIAWDQLGRHGTDSIDVIERRSDGSYGAVQAIAQGLVGLSAVAVNASDDAAIVGSLGTSLCISACSCRPAWREGASVRRLSS